MNDAEKVLGFAVSISNQLKKNSNTCAGAGANANSNADMMQFVGSDALAELVWSPGTGLNIKFAKEKPHYMWEVGPSDMGLYKSESTQDEEQIASLATCHMSEKVAICTGSQNKGIADQLHEHIFEDGMTNGGDGSGCDSKPLLKIEPMMQCTPNKHVESTNNVEMDQVKREKDGCFSEVFLENAQVAIFENKTDEKHQVESDGSMESCRSATFLSKRKGKCSSEQLILRSKRIKNQGDGSSFMNWISNTLKGLKNDPRVGVCNDTRSLESKHFGFHNVFHSLLSPETVKQFENKSIGSSKKTVLAEKCSHGSLGCLEIKSKETDNHAKHTSFYERVTKQTPTEIFGTIRKLRLSRTDIHKWMNSPSSAAHLDGFFLRLRVAKWEVGAGGSRYYVACITGSQGGTPWKYLKQSIRVKVGDVECLVQSQYISNCDFLDDELIAWWQKSSENGGIPAVKDLKSKLAERRTLGM